MHSSGGGGRQVTADFTVGRTALVAHLGDTYGCDVVEGGDGGSVTFWLGAR